MAELRRRPAHTLARSQRKPGVAVACVVKPRRPHPLGLDPISHWGGYTTYRLVFGAAHATPSLVSPALGALGGLMGVAVVYVILKRGAQR